jgi:hypothetical protein
MSNIRSEANPSGSVDTRHRLFDLSGLVSLIDEIYPRLMSQIDRDPGSPTYGSSDRSFFMYRLHDFDTGVVQQTGLTLAALCGLASHVDFTECRYLSAEKVGYWSNLAHAINKRTSRLLEKRGYLDEYFPGESSYPGTVFAVYATLKSALMLGQQDIVESHGLALAAHVLANRSPSVASNQDIAAAAFLALYAKTTNDRSLDATVKRLVAGKNGKDDFFEYGGFDVGYGTVTLAYLAAMHADETCDVASPMASLASVLADFITPSGGMGGEFASRSTTYFLPFGLAVAGSLLPEKTERFATLDVKANFEKLDDRYLMHYCLPSLARTALHLAENGNPEFHSQIDSGNWQRIDLQDAGIFGLRRAGATLYIGLNKGGAFQYENEERIFIDTGYRVNSGGGTYATSVISENVQWKVADEENSITVTVEAPFERYRLLVASPTKTIILRLMRFFGPSLNAFFKRKMITQTDRAKGINLTRKISIDLVSNRMTIEDSVSGLKQGDELLVSPPWSLRTVPSARFFQIGEEEAHSRIATSLSTRQQTISI